MVEERANPAAGELDREAVARLQAEDALRQLDIYGGPAFDLVARFGAAEVMAGIGVVHEREQAGGSVHNYRSYLTAILVKREQQEAAASMPSAARADDPAWVAAQNERLRQHYIAEGKRVGVANPVEEADEVMVGHRLGLMVMLHQASPGQERLWHRIGLEGCIRRQLALPARQGRAAKSDLEAVLAKCPSHAEVMAWRSA